MAKTTLKLPGFEGVAAGQTATLRMPIGRTYETIYISFTGATIAQLNEMRIIANGNVIHRITEFTKLDAMNQFCGREVQSDGVIAFDFVRHGMRTRASEEVYALGTGILNDPRRVVTLSLEIDIDSDASSPTLSAIAITSNPRLSGNVIYTKEFTYTVSAAGIFEISDLPKGDAINKIYFGGSSTTVIKSLEVEKDNFIEFTRTTAQNDKIQEDGKRDPQTGYYVYDPTELGNNDALPTRNVSDLRFRLDCTNAGALPVTVEYIAPIEV